MSKTVLVTRLGAWGDHLIAMPLLKRLKQDGWTVTYNTNSRAAQVIKNCPYIDSLMPHDENIPNEQLGPHWEKIGKGFDKFINLSESIEGRFLFTKLDRWKDKYYAPLEERRKLAGNTNYYKYTLELGGYTDVKNPRPELFPSVSERKWCLDFRLRHKDDFLIMWNLSGSAPHKAWMQAEECALNLLDTFTDIQTITTGGEVCRLLEWDHARNLKRCGEDGWNIRTAMLMCNYVDLVISPESAILNAAGCYDVPKIGLLTHSNAMNLTSTFINDYSIQADIECSPCHRMIYPDTLKESCPLAHDSQGELPYAACAMAFDPDKVFKIIEGIYYDWHEKRKTIPKVKVYGDKTWELSGHPRLIS
jgi:ADP-heptose:LPS heptosyltransferase